MFNLLDVSKGPGIDGWPTESVESSTLEEKHSGPFVGQAMRRSPGHRRSRCLTREQVLLNALRHSKIALELKPGDLLLVKLFQ